MLEAERRPVRVPMGKETRGGGHDVEVAFVQFEEWLDEGDAQAGGGCECSM